MLNFDDLVRYLFVLLISIYILEEREWILFCPHQNARLAYYLQTNQSKLKNFYLDVPLSFLYIPILENQTSIIGI